MRGDCTSPCLQFLYMCHTLDRRTLLKAAAGIPLATACNWWVAALSHAASARTRLEQLELELNGRLGVFALNTRNGAHLQYRANERFPVCSTFKVILASAILDRSTGATGLMQQLIRYAQSDLVEYSPITSKHMEDGMTVAALCAATIQYSDNTAGNLLMKILGGPTAVTAYARSIDDREFRLDRWEPDLNTAIPGDTRDTSTPQAMGRSLQRLAFEHVLSDAQQYQLLDWMRGNTTGAARIRAGVPGDWQVADKTGSGSYGTANDLAVIWPTNHPPVVLAIYTTQSEKDTKAHNDLVASAARIVVDWIAEKKGQIGTQDSYFPMQIF